jgi:dihydrofolate reductase
VSTPVSIIVAASANNVIGADGGLPWRLPEDLRRFKRITMGKPMIMGRLTFESIGRALPGRRSIVVTRQADYTAEGCDVVATPEAALELASNADEVMIVGGGKIYEQLLPLANRIYMTRVHAEISGDTFFPEIDADEWRIVSSEPLPATDERPYSISLQTLERVL